MQKPMKGAYGHVTFSDDRAIKKSKLMDETCMIGANINEAVIHATKRGIPNVIDGDSAVRGDEIVIDMPMVGDTLFKYVRTQGWKTRLDNIMTVTTAVVLGLHGAFRVHFFRPRHAKHACVALYIRARRAA